ncbi:MAG: hypothetical protein Q9173_005223 [Seirophora scorigena]
MADLEWLEVEQNNANRFAAIAIQRFPSTTLTGRALQKFKDKWYKAQEKANRARTERGETNFKERHHHCVECHKAYGHVCRAKGHMVQCEVHPGNNFKPGKTCAECDVEEAAKIRKAKKIREQEMKRPKKQREHARLVIDKKRKKPGPKAGRFSQRSQRQEGPEAQGQRRREQARR